MILALSYSTNQKILRPCFEHFKIRFVVKEFQYQNKEADLHSNFHNFQRTFALLELSVVKKNLQSSPFYFILEFLLIGSTVQGTISFYSISYHLESCLHQTNIYPNCYVAINQLVKHHLSHNAFRITLLQASPVKRWTQLFTHWSIPLGKLQEDQAKEHHSWELGRHCLARYGHLPEHELG